MKLKTLKDLNLNYEDVWDIKKGTPEKILKAEAIKWEKECLKVNASIAWAMWEKFFNITEEDLKCQ